VSIWRVLNFTSCALEVNLLALELNSWCFLQS
jgi:hypothetical protein